MELFGTELKLMPKDLMISLNQRKLIIHPRIKEEYKDINSIKNHDKI